MNKSNNNETFKAVSAIHDAMMRNVDGDRVLFIRSLFIPKIANSDFVYKAKIAISKNENMASFDTLVKFVPESSTTIGGKIQPHTGIFVPHSAYKSWFRNGALFEIKQLKKTDLKQFQFH